MIRIAEGFAGYIQFPGEVEPRKFWYEHVDLNDEWEPDRITAVSFEGRFPGGYEFGFELKYEQLNALIGHLRRIERERRPRVKGGHCR